METVLNPKVTIDLQLSKLIELMEKGVLCGADIHTSDPEMKAMVRQACLKSCVKKMCAHCQLQSFCEQPIVVSSVISVRPTGTGQSN